MSDIILLVIVALAGALLGGCAVAWWHVCPPPVPAVPAIVPSSPPPPPLAPKVAPLPTWTVRFVSGSGRVLGETTYRGRRPQSMVYRTGDGLLGSFVASRCVAGVWEYRRVGVEREGGEKR
jgi:hypothetical protein